MTSLSAIEASHSVDPDAAHNLYCAEIAFHEARQTHVDEWIRAAADRLHEAIVLCGIDQTPK